jgi:hypothetical protein
MTLSDLVCNSLDHTYSLEQAAADLGELMMERERVRRQYDPASPRLRELEQLIPIQETLALGKLRGDEVFDRLARLGVRVEKS